MELINIHKKREKLRLRFDKEREKLDPKCAEYPSQCQKIQERLDCADFQLIVFVLLIRAMVLISIISVILFFKRSK